MLLSFVKNEDTFLIKINSKFFSLNESSIPQKNLDFNPDVKTLIGEKFSLDPQKNEVLQINSGSSEISQIFLMFPNAFLVQNL